MADGAILLTGLSVLLNVEEEFRQEIEPVQTLLLQTEEMTVKETALKQENVTRKAARVGLSKNFLSIGFWHIFRLRQKFVFRTDFVTIAVLRRTKLLNHRDNFSQWRMEQLY